MNGPDPSLAAWPFFGLEDDQRPALARARAANQAIALVTLIRTDFSAPRPVGTQMTVSETELRGYFSGGCVEADVAIHARRTLEDGEPRRLVYGQGSPWPDIALLCGSRIELLSERIAPDDPATQTLLDLARLRRPALWRSDGVTRHCTALESGGLAPALDLTEAPFGVSLYFPPPPRLIVVGADPTALAITELGRWMGIETHLIRHKGPAAAPFAGMEGLYHAKAPAEALDDIGLDPWSFVAIATHDAALDLEACQAALATPAPYVGVLGARKRFAARHQDLARLGVSESDIGRLKAPIGLDLGGKSPREIALSVLAQITAQIHHHRPSGCPAP